MVIFRSILLRMRNIWDRLVEKIKRRILYSMNFFRKLCRWWENLAQYRRTGEVTYDNIIRFMRFARWITEATNTHSQYVVPIVFPRQQWLRQGRLNATFTRTLPLLLPVPIRSKCEKYLSFHPSLWRSTAVRLPVMSLLIVHLFDRQWTACPSVMGDHKS
jgi:hypothetical protein